MFKSIIIALAIITTSASSAQAVKHNNSDHVLPVVVSWYGGSHHGKVMANSQRFDKNKLTCAATNKYKFGDILEVTNIENCKTVIVTVTDRGKFKRLGRELDLSERAFEEIASLKKGIIKVTIKKLN